MIGRHLKLGAGLVEQRHDGNPHEPVIVLRFAIESARTVARRVPGLLGHVTREPGDPVVIELGVPLRTTRGALAELLEGLVVTLRDPKT